MLLKLKSKCDIEVRIGPIIKEVIKIEIIGPDKAIKTTILERTLEGMEDKVVEEDMGVIGAMIITGVETDQEKGHSQEILVTIGIEVPVTVD